MESILDVMKKRRSVRKYKAEQIKEESLQRIIEAGQLAPSGHNSQTSHFVVIQSSVILDELREVVKKAFAKLELPDDAHDVMRTPIRLAQKGQYNFMYNPPTFIIAANQRGYGNAMADCSLALGNMMLMAAELNIGSCWINQLRWLSDDETVIEYLKKLGIGADEVVCGCLGVGYSDQPELSAPVRKGNKAEVIS